MVFSLHTNKDTIITDRYDRIVEKNESLHYNGSYKNSKLFRFLFPVTAFIVFIFIFSIRSSAPNIDTGTVFQELINEFKQVPNEVKQVRFKSYTQCENIPDTEKYDCFPRGICSYKACLARNCCWVPVEDNETPWCYYSKGYETYKVVNITQFKTGHKLLLNITSNSTYPNNIQQLQMNVLYRTEYSLHIKIFDPHNQRYEPSYPEVPLVSQLASDKKQYDIQFDTNKFGFTIIRNSTKEIIFDTKDVGRFIFADQFLQLSAQLPSKYIYGLGEHRNNFLLSTKWNRITLFNCGKPPADGRNGYGSHPFFMGIEQSGLFYGVFLLNSNAMDIILQPAPAITYRAIGGIFDFYFFFGPTPADVISQYTEVIGRPFLPPFWSLGFHLSKFGLKSLNDTVNVWNRTRIAGLPYDAQWNDVDYMYDRNDFTIGNSYKGLPDFVKQLHKDNMKYVVITDPGIASREPRYSYPPYDDGLRANIFIKNSSGLPLEGKVWNLKGGTVFPDFTDPNVIQYWMVQINRLYDKLFFDGLWLDMNEVTNFVDGSQEECKFNDTRWENPPYVPRVYDDTLNKFTLCMSAKQYAGLHYDVHNLYGFAESMITNFVLSTLSGKRAFILSRSTFPGFGKYGAHWTGDISSTWDDMKHSVYDIMSFNLLGIPMVGADICGFIGNVTIELCQRWSQLGAFYPFSRNHNDYNSMDQDPASLGSSVINSTKMALLTRYTLLPYLYTLFWRAHTFGETVVRPLFFEFANDTNTYEVNKQFLWGSAVMIIPVLDEGHTFVNAYLPNITWYHFKTGKAVIGNGSYMNLSAPLHIIPVLLRSGYIIPCQQPGITTVETRKNNLELLVMNNEFERASGYLYWDDGEAQNTWSLMKYNTISFKLINKQLSSVVEHWGYNTKLILGKVLVYGASFPISSVTVNGEVYLNWSYDTALQVFTINDMNVDLKKPFVIQWK